MNATIKVSEFHVNERIRRQIENNVRRKQNELD